MARDFNPADTGYVDVAARIVEFRAKHPEGSLQPVDPANPFEVKVIGDKAFIVYTAAAYRTPDDTRPGIGIAWEPFPGATPYTRNSELMNAETSAWGRAIIAVGAADSKRGIASHEEVRNRQAERDEPQQDEPQWEGPLPDPVTDQPWMDGFEARVGAVTTQGELKGLFGELHVKHQRRELTDEDRAVLVQLVTMRKTELEESPA